LQLGDKGGFINFTGDFDVREHYSRMKEFEGGVFSQPILGRDQVFRQSVNGT